MRSKKWACISIGFLALVIIIVASILTAHGRLMPDNPISGLDPDRSQGLIVGKGYAMDKEKKADYQKQKKEKEQKKDSEQETSKRETAQNTQNTSGDPDLKVPGNQGDTSSGSGDEGDAQAPADELPPEPDDPELPTIKTNLTQGQEVGGGYVGFWIKATDFKGRYIDASGLTLTLNGNKLYSSGDTGSRVNYGTEIADGENTLKITATDSYGKSKTVVYTLIGDSGKEGESEGYITFSLEAHTVGLGYLISPTTVKVPAGKPFPYTLKQVLEKYGFGMVYKGSLNTGFYLQEVTKAGITNGCKIPDELQQKLDDEGTDKKGHEADSLGEADFTKFSGWIYQVNGSTMSSGISSYIPTDGDEVRIRFSLWYGEDLGGSWGDW